MANSMTKFKLWDGRKAVDIWGDSNEGWTILGDDGKTNQGEYYKFIPTLYRAVQLRSYSVSTMPFVLYKGKKEYDSSTEWENKVGFLPNPATFLQLIESALVMFGRAYFFKERSVAMIKALRYHLPSSITP